MSDLITQLWEGLRDSGLPEVMLYLSDGTASRCHWNDTALIGDVRVALVGDQDRGIVRIIPVSSCTGIGIAAPKGTDPTAYRPMVHQKLLSRPEPEPAPPPNVSPEHPPRRSRQAGGPQRPAFRAERGWNERWTSMSRLISTRV